MVTVKSPLQFLSIALRIKSVLWYRLIALLPLQSKEVKKIVVQPPIRIQGTQDLHGQHESQNTILNKNLSLSLNQRTSNQNSSRSCSFLHTSDVEVPYLNIPTTHRLHENKLSVFCRPLITCPSLVSCNLKGMAL